jgi:hypothetical protein
MKHRRIIVTHYGGPEAIQVRQGHLRGRRDYGRHRAKDSANKNRLPHKVFHLHSFRPNGVFEHRILLRIWALTFVEPQICVKGIN